MAIKIKFFIRVSKKSNSKDEATIRVRFTNGRIFDLWAKTEFQIKPEFWSNTAGTYAQRAAMINREEKVKKLNELEQFIKDKYFNLPDNSKANREWLTETIDKYHNPGKYLQENTTLFGFIQHFIDNSTKRTNTETGQPVSYRMRREYEITFNYLKKYAEKNKKEPDFIDIDLEFYNDFIDFLRKQKVIIKDKNGNIVKEKYLAVNTIGKKIQTLKVFLNAATEQGVNKYMKYKSRKFKALSEEAENIYLTKEELKKFYEHDFSNKPYLERVRDLFIVASWTGVRYSDIQQIKPERIVDNIFTLKQQKTGKKAFIPINDVVRNVIKKYNGKLPNPISNQKFNDYLKEAARIAEINSVFIKTETINGMRIEKKYPKHEVISTHTARRSFCTNAYKDGIPSLSIMAISGHKTEKAFLKYIKVDGEEHAKKVLEMWQKNGEFMKVVK
jgi:site-specific recombinase XerD